MGRAMLALRRARRDLERAPIGELLPLAAIPEFGTEIAVHGAATGTISGARLQAAGRWVSALKRAERYGPWRGACLVRSLALHRLLERGGVPGSVVRVGVRLGGDSNPAFEAHAWVEVQGVVVGDRPSVKTQWTMLGTSEGTAMANTVHQLVAQESR